jgi:hypothetical protein
MVCIAGIVRPEDQCAKEQEFSYEENISKGKFMRAQNLKKGSPIHERKNGPREKNDHGEKKQQAFTSLVVVDLPRTPA